MCDICLHLSLPLFLPLNSLIKRRGEGRGVRGEGWG